jgi:flagellar assembly protein FliH
MALGTARTLNQEKPGKSPVKFLFDDEFGSDGRAKRTKLTVSEHETLLVGAQEESFRQGFAAAQAEMTASDQHRIALAAEKIADAMEMIAHQMVTLEQRLEAEAVEVALSAARKLAPALIEREPLAEIEQLVADVFGQLRSAPHVAVRLPETLIDGASAHLMKLAQERGYAGRLVLLPDPDLGPDDCKIEWADGGVVRDRAGIESRIGEAVNRYLGRKERKANNPDLETDR